MKGPLLGPSEEDITWPDQVAPAPERHLVPAKSNLKPQTSNLNPSVELNPPGPSGCNYGALVGL